MDKSALGLIIELQNGEPSINADPSKHSEGIVVFNPTCLKEHETALIGARLKQLLSES